MLLGLITLVVLSVACPAYVWWLLSRPWRPDLLPVVAPLVVAAVPNMTFDHRGLV